jgi:hypothetical protein
MQKGCQQHIRYMLLLRSPLLPYDTVSYSTVILLSEGIMGQPLQLMNGVALVSLTPTLVLDLPLQLCLESSAFLLSFLDLSQTCDRNPTQHHTRAFTNTFRLD